MSLKAKLEAVIYAAEEPVTLAQLAMLFAEEALVWKAEQTEALPFPETAEESPAAVELYESGQENGAELTALLVTGENAATAPSIPIDTITAETIPAESVTSEAAAVEANREQPASEPAPLTAEEAELEARRQERKRERDAREILRSILDELIAEYDVDARGIEIREIAGGFRMGTKPEMHDAVRAFVKSLKPPMKLSLPALETLAVIAYKQPVTAPEVGEIRGVDSAGVLGSLMSRKLIATAGRKQVIGRPMLYKTTKEFLLRFGLKDVSELPSMEEFEKMAALELSDGEDSDETAGQSGDLFAESETATVPLTVTETETEDETAVTPTTEASDEAADEQTPVERQDEIEVEK